MALISCPECGKDISDKVKACPHCGYPLVEETQVNVQPQPVELKSVNLTNRDPAKTRKILLAGFGVILFFALLAIVAFLGNDQKQKARKNDYIDKVVSVRSMMLDGSSAAETLANLTAQVWQDTIYENLDPKTSKFTLSKYGGFNSDFNTSLNALFSDTNTQVTIGYIEDNQQSVSDLMKELKDPPVGMEICSESLMELYSAYQGITDLAINPKGSLSTFIPSKNEKVDKFLEYYKKLETLIPEKEKLLFE
jgi:hypothetical protein